MMREKEKLLVMKKVIIMMMKNGIYNGMKNEVMENMGQLYESSVR
jgi:hypothetical protein